MTLVRNGVFCFFLAPGRREPCLEYVSEESIMSSDIQYRTSCPTASEAADREEPEALVARMMPNVSVKLLGR